ncbi:MAG: hypothetical protein E7Z96_02685 [Actinomycetaceae bacterium]|nr:hypothetical protein [Actinomycetaceae bacterium]
MTRIGIATVQIQPSFKGFQASAKKSILAELGPLGKEIGDGTGGRFGTHILSSAGQKLKAGAAKVAKIGGGLFATGLTVSLTKGFTRSKAIEEAEAKLRGLGKSTQEVSAIMDDALKSVQGTAYGLDEASTTAGILVAAGVKSGEELEKTLKLVADSATIAGRDMGDMGLIWSSVASQGKLQGQDAMQLMQSGIPIWQMVGDVMGVTAAEAQELGSKGQVSFEIFRKAMEEGVGGAALSAGETTTGAFKNFMASVSRFGQTLLQDIYPMIGPALKSLTSWVDGLAGKAGPAIENVIDGLRGVASILFKGDFTGSFWGLEEDSPVIGFLFRLRETAIDVFGRLRSGLASFAEGVKGIFNILVRGDFTSFWGMEEDSPFVDALFKVREFIGSAWDTIRDVVPKIVSIVREQVFPAIKDTIVWLWDHKDWVAAWVAALAGAFAAYKIGKKITEVVTALGKIAPAISKAMKVLMANPVVLIIAAIVGVLILLWTKCEAFRDAVKTIVATIGRIVKTVWENVIRPAFEAVRSFIMDTLVPALTSFWQNTVQPIITKVGEILRNVWEGVIRPVIAALIEFVTERLIPTVMSLWRNVIQPVVTAIMGFIKGAWENVIQPVFATIKNVISNVLGPIFTWLYETIIRPVWDKITEAIRIAWGIIQIIWDTIKWTIDNVLGPVFTWLWEKVIQPAWEGISGAISWAWEHVISPAFEAVKDAVGLVGEAFETVKDVVVGAWETMVNLLVKPINFVIGTVYNNGIRKAFNWVAQAVGSSIRLEEASTINPFPSQSTSKPSTSGRLAAGPLNWEARAKGGWTPPGWTLVGEEGPELVNFSRPSRVYTAEETAAALAGADISPYLRPDRMYTPDEAWTAIHALKTGDQRLLQGALGPSPSQSLLPIGGFWDSLGHAWSKTWRGVKDFVADGISWVRGRLADAAGLVLNPIKEQIASMVEGHGTISDMVGDAFRRTIDNLLEWVRGVDEESNESGETSEAKNNAAAMNEAAVSGADLKELQRNAVVLGGVTRRPVKGGVLTSTFGVSRYGGYHAGIDLAAPTGTPVYAYRSGTVLGTGWNVLAGRSGIGIMLSHGQYGGSYYGHLSASKVHRGQAVTAGQLIGLVGATGNATGPHLHWELNRGNWQSPYNPLPFLPAYDQGGWLLPGMGTVANLTGSPEPVLTQAQWDAISTLAARGAGVGLPDRVTLVDADGSILARARVVAGEVVERAADEAARWE